MKIFQKVHCKAYLKKYHDGICLNCWEEKGNEDFLMSHPAVGSSWKNPIRVTAVKTEYTSKGYETKEIADLSGFEGETVEKQYRIRVEEEFDGFLVGITRITVTGRIGTDMTMHPYNMNGDLEEIYHLTKDTDKQKVGVVYFKNNAKRYVLLDDMRGEEE